MKRYTIGEVSRITGISRDLLRFYDRIGLLKPAVIDPANRYRYYTYDQFWLIDIIQMCRGLEIPLKDIAQILQSRDDEKVLRLLIDHQQTALDKSRYYRQISEDISWYSDQRELVQAAHDTGKIEICHLPSRPVLFGKNKKDVHLYHLELQDLCLRALEHPNVFCRHYGWVLDAQAMKEQRFLKEAEYLYFEENILDQVEQEYITWLPEGEYACCLTNVIDGYADFTTILKWCEEREIEVGYVIADEIGLHLFPYENKNYLCRVCVKVKEISV